MTKTQVKVTVVAKFKVKPGQADNLLRELRTVVDLTRQEPGCVNYDLFQSQEDPGEFIFYENWTDSDALDAHLQMPYIQAMFDKTDELLESDVEITRWSQVL